MKPIIMHRSHNCGELSESNLNQEVTLAGWVQKIRNKGFIAWIDLRDRYGITQLVFDETRTPKAVFKKSTGIGREDVIQVKGLVIERESKNLNILGEYRNISFRIKHFKPLGNSSFYN